MSEPNEEYKSHRSELSGLWQYKILDVGATYANRASDLLTEHGLQGWELVAVDQNRAFFKRPWWAE